MECARIETAQVREQRIDLKAGFAWRRIELMLDTPTEAGDTVIRLWSNLPATVGAHSGIRVPRCWALPERFWRTTCWLCSSAASKSPMLKLMKPTLRHPTFGRITWHYLFAASMRVCSLRCRTSTGRTGAMPQSTTTDSPDDTQSTTTSDATKQANHSDGASMPSGSTTTVTASPTQQDKPNPEKPAEDATDDRPVRSDSDLYSKKSNTFQTVIKSWQHQVGKAPFIVAAKRFLSVNVNKGSCPQWPLSVPYLHLNAQLGAYFCSPAMSSALAVIGVGVMIGAAFVAFRMAFL